MMRRYQEAGYRNPWILSGTLYTERKRGLPRARPPRERQLCLGLGRRDKYAALS